MSLSLSLLVCLVIVAEPPPLEAQEKEIAEVAEVALKCASSNDLDPLFQLAASGKIGGAHTSEELSEVNEEVFLQCPLIFLRAFKAQSETTRNAVLDYFGIRHAPWELGAELRKYQDHEEVGKVVRPHFSPYLEAKEPQ